MTSSTDRIDLSTLDKLFIPTILLRDLSGVLPPENFGNLLTVLPRHIILYESPKRLQLTKWLCYHGGQNQTSISEHEVEHCLLKSKALMACARLVTAASISDPDE